MRIDKHLIILALETLLEQVKDSETHFGNSHKQKRIEEQIKHIKENI